MNKMNALTRGVVVFVILAVLTIIEYIVAGFGVSATVFLVLLALAKAGLVLWYFMHLPRVFKSESEGGHE
jgi:heme/copper-type cytochrome/quinol oxidase subunit 4